MEQRVIQVFADWAGLGGPTWMGTLQVGRLRGKELFMFAYADEWLERPGPSHLDPRLQLFAGPQYPAGDQMGFGLFMDSAPDRWGRMLMQRQEARSARAEGRVVRHLSTTDQLLRVSDVGRMGALRFRMEGGPFLAEGSVDAMPPWAGLRHLEQAA